MNENIKLPFNDVYFYGVSLKSRDVHDIRNDIFSNILMRYLRTLKPVASKLYRTAENNKFEYSYSFVPTKPLSWRVIKNRRIIEDIEQLSDGKYCLNYYDDQGRDIKRVLFSKHHKWQKTNYYNSVSGNTLLCSIVPKEKNGETIILQYITGETYPITLYCCPVASCNEVLISVLNRVPEPEAMALTNYGVLYFASEETLNIYKQVLKEEEEKHAQLNKPEVFTTEEDISSGFCFDVSSFDTTKAIGSMFDLSEAQELTEKGFSDNDESEEIADKLSCDVDESVKSVTSANMPHEVEQIEISDADESYSLEADITDAIKLISDATDIKIDKNKVFNSVAEWDNPLDVTSVSAEDACDDIEKPSDVNVDTVQMEVSFDIQDAVDSIDSLVISVDDTSSKVNSDDILEVNSSDDELNLLTMKDEDIDDYVQSLIDSLLLDAKTVAEYKDSADDAFAAGAQELFLTSCDGSFKAMDQLVSENTADAVISSNGADYFYYGETDSNGLRCGRGKTLMSDGKTAYEGEYKDDKRHGNGSFYYKDGSLCYWGNWRDNLRKGFGVGISSETGTIHTGTWNNNKPVGVGVRFDKDGNFMYVDSACHKTNGGIRVTGFTESSLLVEYWDENSLRTIKKEISLDDLK